MKIRKNLNLDIDLKNSFKVEVYDKMKDNLIDCFINLANCERKGQVVDFSILKNFVKFLQSIEINYLELLYNIDLEQRIIESSVNFYNSLINETLNTNSFNTYLKWGVEVLKKEEERMTSYLPYETIKRIISLLKEIIFFNQSKSLLSSTGFKKILSDLNISLSSQVSNSSNYNQEFNDLKISFEIFSQDSKSFNTMLSIFKSFIREEFLHLIAKNEKICPEAETPKEIINKTNYIEEFMNFYLINSKIISEAFMMNNLFNVSFKEAIENIQSNYVTYNNSYLLPFYIDKYFKRSTGNSEESLKLIEKIINIFPTLPDKDVFIDIHRNLLSNRILTEDFISLENEKNLICKVKLLCGVEFTSNIEGMMLDYYSTREVNERYKTFLKSGNTDSVLPKIENNVKNKYLIISLLYLH